MSKEVNKKICYFSIIQYENNIFEKFNIGVFLYYDKKLIYKITNNFKIIDKINKYNEFNKVNEFIENSKTVLEIKCKENLDVNKLTAYIKTRCDDLQFIDLRPVAVYDDKYNEQLEYLYNCYIK